MCRHSFTLIFSTLLAGLFLSSCTPQEDEIELGYVHWDSEIASTHVVAAVIEDELGYEVTTTAVGTEPLWRGLAQGNFNATVSAWLPETHRGFWEEYQDDLVDLGPNLEGARTGWVVPEYTPIESMTEANDFYDEFNGQVIGIDRGAGLMTASQQAIETYGIELELTEGSDAEMTSALESAYNNQEHIVVTGWTPHWKFASYDLKFLDDPENVFGSIESIHTIVTPELQEENEEVYEFLDNFFWANQQIGEVMVMIQEGMDPMAAARAWVSENETQVEVWLE